MHASSLKDKFFEKELLWSPEIEYILLDMDGTILDRHFDDYFWEELLPLKYAGIHCLDVGSAKKELLGVYKRHEGTLNWTDIDFWSEELGLDIPTLKKEAEHLISFHPRAEEFLTALNEARKKVYLITDAHCKVVQLKMRKTELDRYFDAWVTSFEIGFPKQNPLFWERAEEELGFRKESSLFIDDREVILRTARDFGIKYTLHKANANSRKRPDFSEEFCSIADYVELLLENQTILRGNSSSPEVCPITGIVAREVEDGPKYSRILGAIP